MGKLRRDLVLQCGNRICISGLFGRENEVPDVDRYRIVRAEQTGARGDPSQPACAITVKDHQIVNAAPIQPTVSGHRSPFVSMHPYVDRPVASDCALPLLVIVLESPHRDEYGRSVKEPIAPARGKTGSRIHKYLCDVLNSCAQMTRLLFDRAPVRVAISNPIPFQTSAYAIDGGRLDVSDRLRNFIWKALWSMEDDNESKCFQEKFVAKLYCYNPIAIINACTSGGNPKRRSEITRVIQAPTSFCGNRLRDIPLYETDHPSIWGRDTRLTCV